MKLLGVGVLCFALFQLVVSKPPVVIHPRNPNDSLKLKPGVVRNVLVIGAGLAGLSASLELAERGYNVTIKEKSALVGGKLFSKPIQLFAANETFLVEHGFHAWFHNYHQFHDIIRRLNISSNFKKWDKVHYVFKKYKPEVIWSEGQYPVNLIKIIQRSPNLKLKDALNSLTSVSEMVFFDYKKVFEQHDHLSFREWASNQTIDKTFYDIILNPALSVTLNERDGISAAEMLVFIHMYFLSDAKADNREITRSNSYESVLKPWIDRLQSLNTKILTNSAVESLRIDQETVIGMNDDRQNYDYVIIASDVGSTQRILTSTIDKARGTKLAKLYEDSIGKMKIAPAYKILRVWFDKQLSRRTPSIIETPDYDSINLIIQYSKIHTDYIQWSARTGGSVIEFHCYTWNKYFNRTDIPDKDIWPLVAPTVRKILPEIFNRNFKLLAYHVNSFQDFSSFEKGLAQHRPFVDSLQSVLKNVYLAGDWVKTRYVSCLMEKAVSTGREAANEILIRDGVRQSKLVVTNPSGPGLF